MSERNGSFLNAADIRTTIDENVDENASHFIFMSAYGTVLGHDSNTDYKVACKFGAFAGTTWLRHSKAIADSGQASKEPDIGLGGKTLKVVIAQGSKGLHSLIIQFGILIAVVHHVKEKTLLAALLEADHFADEDDDCAPIVMGLDMGRDKPLDDVASTHKENGTHITENDATEQESESEHTQETAVSSNDGKLSKMRILEIRAETIAKDFAERICGAEFVMPEDFF